MIARGDVLFELIQTQRLLRCARCLGGQIAARGAYRHQPVGDLTVVLVGLGLFGIEIGAAVDRQCFSGIPPHIVEVLLLLEEPKHLLGLSEPALRDEQVGQAAISRGNGSKVASLQMLLQPLDIPANILVLVDSLLAKENRESRMPLRLPVTHQAAEGGALKSGIIRRGACEVQRLGIMPERVSFVSEIQVRLGHATQRIHLTRAVSSSALHGQRPSIIFQGLGQRPKRTSVARRRPQPRVAKPTRGSARDSASPLRSRKGCVLSVQ